MGGMAINPTGAQGWGGAVPTNGPPLSSGGIADNPWGANPTMGPTMGGKSAWGSVAPPTGSPGNFGYGASANPNPTMPISNQTGPTTSMNPGTTGAPPPVTGGVGAGSSTNSQLNSPLGTGLGPQVQTFLNSDGGYNSGLTQQAVKAQTAEMQLQAETNYGNLESGLGAAGISPNSSAAALEGSNFWSQTTAAENAMTAQEFFSMWQSSMGNETSMLEAAMGPSHDTQMNQPSLLDQIGSGFDIAGSIGGMFPNG